MKRVAWLAMLWLTGTRAATVTGMVVDQLDQPVPGATVRAWDGDEPEVAVQAGADGRFTLELNRPAGLWRELTIGAFMPDGAFVLTSSEESLERQEQPLRLRLGPAARL